jgi:hypothetical protein
MIPNTKLWIVRQPNNKLFLYSEKPSNDNIENSIEINSELYPEVTTANSPQMLVSFLSVLKNII